MGIKNILYFIISGFVVLSIAFSTILSETPGEIPVVENISSCEITYASTATEIKQQTSSVTTVTTSCISENISHITEIATVSVYEDAILQCEVPQTENFFEEPVLFPIDLNTASSEQLMLIDGIGEALSQKIIQYRENNGRFYSMYQLTEINGIGEAKLEKFRQYLYIENETEYIIDNKDNQQECISEIIEIEYTEQEETYPDVEEFTEEISYQETEIPMIEMNTATAEDFMKIPEIDEDTAYKIIELREKIQYFSHPYELLYVDGISEILLSSFIKYLYIEGREDIIY